MSERETARLFALIARLRERGIAMIYISHTLADVFRLSDDIVVLRDGEAAGSGETSTFTNEKLISLMVVGRTMSQLFPERRSPTRRDQSDQRAGSETGAPILEVRGVSQPGVVENISFTLHRGEVLGLAGLMGAGRSELARILFGLDPRKAGEVRLNDELLPRLAPRELIQRGVAFLTENRRSEGLCLDATVADNFALVTLPQHGRTPLRWLLRDSLQAAVTRIREVAKVDPTS